MITSGAVLFAAGALSDASHELDGRFEDARTQFARWTEGVPLQTEWRTTIGFPAQSIVAMAGRADLIVVGPARKPSPANSYLDYSDVIMRAGRPVLAVPHGRTKLDLRHAVVAWRNTREARRALADALPLLALASEVSLIHVRESGDDPGERASLEDAMAFLDAHGIAAESKVLDTEHLPPAEQIVAFATDAGAGLIVSGAYGHTRIREWVFGGVTRELLHNCPIPCLFGH
jgi:nucleotide-binding universal stress UspA family protein